MYEAADAEEAEIINRHLGKWGDRRVYVERPDKKSDRRGKESRRGEGREGKRFDNRENRRFEDRENKRFENRGENRPDTRESRQAIRKEFFSKQGESKKPFRDKASDEGRRDYREERRPRRDGERPARKFDGPKRDSRPFRGKKD